MNIQNCLPPGWTTKTRKSTKTGDYLVLIFKPDGKEYCRGEVDITISLAESSCSTAYLKQKDKDRIANQNGVLGGLGADGGVKTKPLMSGRVAARSMPVIPAPLPPVYTKFFEDPERAWYKPPPKARKPAGLRTFKCELQVSAQFPPGADANTFCDDLSAALRVLMSGRSAQITMGNIEEK
jgi:hypothetical protein